MEQQMPPNSAVQQPQQASGVQPLQQQNLASIVTPKTPFNKTLAIIMGLFVLSLIVCSSYYAGMQSQKASDKLTNPYLKNIDATVAPSVAPTVTPTPDPTAEWLLYSNVKYGYSLKYPNALTVNEQSQYYYYIEFDLPVGVDGSHPLPPYMVSVIPDTFVVPDVAAYNYMSSDWINSFYNMKVGDSKTTASGAVFTELPSTTVGKQQAVVVGVVAAGSKQHRVYVKKGGYIYMFSDFYQTDSELANFQLFLSTVKFN